MKRWTAAVTLYGLVWCGSVFAQPAATQPEQLEVLGQYVGHWTSEVTNKPSVWDPNGTRYLTVNQADLILDGWFLQNMEVNHIIDDPDKVTKSLFLWTYDPKSKKYVAWAFQSTGNIAASTGTWDATNKTFALNSVEPPPNTTGKMTEQFPDANTIQGNLTFIDGGGKTLMDMVWTRRRQPESDGLTTRDAWSKNGTPIEPLPDELQELEPLIGDWDAEFINGPSVRSPQGGTAKGKITAQWILDGRFLLGSTELEKHRSIWLIGYDTNKQAYRNVRFTNSGRVDESLGQWNEETRSLVWKVVNEQPGITRTSTNRFVGKDAMQAHILAEDKDGRVQQDLTIKSTRRK